MDLAQSRQRKRRKETLPSKAINNNCSKNACKIFLADTYSTKVITQVKLKEPKRWNSNIIQFSLDDEVIEVRRRYADDRFFRYWVHAKDEVLILAMSVLIMVELLFMYVIKSLYIIARALMKPPSRSNLGIQEAVLSSMNRPQIQFSLHLHRLSWHRILHIFFFH